MNIQPGALGQTNIFLPSGLFLALVRILEFVTSRFKLLSKMHFSKYGKTKKVLCKVSSMENLTTKLFFACLSFSGTCSLEIITFRLKLLSKIQFSKYGKTKKILFRIVDLQNFFMPLVFC
jgi:hypothetical protein